LYPTPLPHTSYMFRPSYSSRFDRLKKYWVQIIKLFIVWTPYYNLLVPTITHFIVIYIYIYILTLYLAATCFG
jgi:hypothetical protein